VGVRGESAVQHSKEKVAEAELMLWILRRHKKYLEQLICKLNLLSTMLYSISRDLLLLTLSTIVYFVISNYYNVPHGRVGHTGESATQASRLLR
jgi:hypothetical protein